MTTHDGSFYPPTVIVRLQLHATSFSFFKMKTKLKGRRFYTVEEIKVETQTVLNTLRKKDLSKVAETLGFLCALPRGLNTY
jgi:hypothetical protein